MLRRFWLGALIAVGLTGCRVGYDLLDSPLSSGGSGSQGSNGTGGVNPSAGGSMASDAGDSGVAASSALGGTGSVATGSGGDSAGAGDSLGDAGQSAAGTGPLGIGGDPGSSTGGTGGTGGSSGSGTGGSSGGGTGGSSGGDTGGSSGGGTGGTGGSSGGGTGGTAGSAGGTGGSSGGGTGGTGGSSGGGTGGSGTGCEPAVPAATWAFDQTVEAWQLSLDSGTSGTFVWTGATGDPTPGALQLDATINGKQAVRVLLEQTFPDLTGKTLYARVFLDSGSGVGIKPFVQTGASYIWAEGPAVGLATKQWTCLKLDLANPTTGTIDPTDVRRIGVVVYGASTLRLYTDYVTY